MFDRRVEIHAWPPTADAKPVGIIDLALAADTASTKPKTNALIRDDGLLIATRSLKNGREFSFALPPKYEVVGRLSVEGGDHWMLDAAGRLVVTERNVRKTTPMSLPTTTHRIVVRSLPDCEIAHTFNHPGQVRRMAVGDDPQVVYTADAKYALRRINVSDGTVREVPTSTGIDDMEVDPRNRILVTIRKRPDAPLISDGVPIPQRPGGIVTLFDLDNLSERPSPVTADDVIDTRTLRDGRLLTVQPQQIEIFDLLRPVRRVAFPRERQISERAPLESGDGRWIVEGNRAWCSRTQPSPIRMKACDSAIAALAFTSDGKRLAIGSALNPFEDNRPQIRILDCERPDKSLMLGRVQGSISHLEFSHDGRYLVSVSGNSILYRSPTGSSTAQDMPVLVGKDGILRSSISFTIVNGRTVPGSSLWSDRFRRVELWDTTTGRSCAVLVNYEIPRSTSTHPRTMEIAKFSPDGKRLAVVAEGKRVSIWDLPNTIRCDLKVSQSTVRDIAFSLDGRLLATADEDGRVRIFEADSGIEKSSLAKHRSGAARLAFVGPDELLVADGIGGLTRHRWGAVVERTEWRSPDESEGADLLAVGGPQGLAATAGGGKQILWDLSGGRRPTPLAWEGGIARSLSLTPDGRTVVGDCWDDQVRVWDTHTGKVRAEYRLQGAAPPMSAAVDSQGRKIAVGTVDGTVYLLAADRLPDAWIDWHGFPDISSNASPDEIVERRGVLHRILERNDEVRYIKDGRGSKLTAATVNEFSVHDYPLECIELKQATDEHLLELKHLPGTQWVRTLGDGYSDESLKALIGLHELRSLYMHGRVVSDSTLAIVGQMKNLEVLVFNKGRITPDGLSKLADLPLRQFEIWDTQCTDDQLQAMAGLRRLENLSLVGSQITDRGVRALAALPLVGVSLLDTQVTDAALAELARIPTLERLTINSSSVERNLISDNGVESLRGSKSLKSLVLGSNLITDASADALASLENLEILRLPNTRVTGSSLPKLKALRRLKWLAIDRAPPVAQTVLDDFRVAVPGCRLTIAAKAALISATPYKDMLQRGLEWVVARKLNVRVKTGDGASISVTRESIPSLLKFEGTVFGNITITKPTDLDLERVVDCAGVDQLILFDPMEITAAGLGQMRRVPTLKRLSLLTTTAPAGSRPGMYDHLIPELISLGQLEGIFLRGPRSIDDEVTRQLSGMKQLHELDLSGCERLTDQGLFHMASLPNLVKLRIHSGLKLTPVGFAALASMPKLSQLSISSGGDSGEELLPIIGRLGRLEVVHLTRFGKLSEIGLRELAKLPRLAEVALVGSRIDDPALKALSECGELSVVNLHNTGITAEGLTYLKSLKKLTQITIGPGIAADTPQLLEFRKALPKCVVYLDSEGAVRRLP